MWFEQHDVNIMGHTGRIALRVYVPTIPLYYSGSPVVVAVQGGFSPDGFNNALDTYFKRGITFVSFLFPGGTDPSTGRSSDGTYDYRGINCLSALYDVLKYAHGDVHDLNGKNNRNL